MEEFFEGIARMEGQAQSADLFRSNKEMEKLRSDMAATEIGGGNGKRQYRRLCLFKGEKKYVLYIFLKKYS